MATIKKNWSAVVQIKGVADGFVTLAGTVQKNTLDVDLETDGYEGAHVIVEINYVGTPTDEVKIKLYGSLDGINYDDTPIWEMQGDKAVSPQQLSFIIRDLAHFRIGFQKDGDNDSHTVRAYVQSWNYQSA